MAEDAFFTAAELKRPRKSLPTLANCGRCGLYRNCATPKMPVYGAGRAGLMVVADAPAKSDDRHGVPLTDPAGRYLADALSAAGLDLADDCWVTFATICHDANRAEPGTAVEDCRPNLMRAIRERNPRVIVLAGPAAVASLLGAVWKPDVGPIGRWTGRRIPAHKPNAWLCPVNAPGHVIRDRASPVERTQFRAALEAAAALARGGAPPWPAGPPDYAARVERITAPGEAARRLAKYTTGLAAVDYETNMLKPDSAAAEIVCAAVCWNGVETIAFPWHGPVIPAMRELLGNPAVGKLASNLDMEDRHTRKHIGIEVRGWAWDSMLAAHCLDPRPGGKESEDGTSFGSGCTGLKYQAFTRLGVPEYNSHIEPYLKSDGGGNAPNRVREVKLPQLLLYCGLDALLEYEVAVDQAAEMGATL